MMSGRTIGWIFAATLTVLPGGALAEDGRRAMEIQQRAYEKAMLTKDIGWFEKTMAADYRETSETGIVTRRKAALAQMKTTFASGQIKKVEGNLLKAWSKGKYWMCLTDMHVVMNQRRSGTSGMDTYDLTAKVELTWSKNGGRWQIHHLKTIHAKGLKNGKTMYTA